MVKEAELHAEEDKREKEKAEARNEADTMIYGTEKNIKDLGDKVSAADKAKAEEAIADLRKALEGDDIQAIKDKTEALKQASYKIAEEIYKAQAAQGGPQGGAGPEAGPGSGPGGFGGDPGAGPNPGDGNTKNAEDVDYEVVDDGEK
jgi:molecular chaperone DnaK